MQELQLKKSFKVISSKLKKDLKELFYEKGVLNFAKFRGKHSVVVSFSVSGLRLAILLKKRLQQRFYPVNTFFPEPLQAAVSEIGVFFKK